MSGPCGDSRASGRAASPGSGFSLRIGSRGCRLSSGSMTTTGGDPAVPFYRVATGRVLMGSAGSWNRRSRPRRSALPAYSNAGSRAHRRFHSQRRMGCASPARVGFLPSLRLAGPPGGKPSLASSMLSRGLGRATGREPASGAVERRPADGQRGRAPRGGAMSVPGSSVVRGRASAVCSEDSRMPDDSSGKSASGQYESLRAPG